MPGPDALRAVLVLLSVAAAATTTTAAPDGVEEAEDGVGSLPLFPPLTISAPHSAVRACAKQSRQLDGALANRTLWAMQMLDASALGLGSVGALSGSVYQLGDFDQCLATSSPWPSQYCLAAIRYRVPHTGARPEHHQVYPANGTVWDKVHYDGVESHLPLDSLTWGLCVPAACDAGEVQAALLEHLRGPAGSRSPASAANITVGHCTAPLHYEADALDAIFGVLVGSLVSLLVVGTLLDLFGQDGCQSENKGRQGRQGRLPLGPRVLLCFSLRRSLRSLVAAEPQPGGVDLEPVAGVRFINMLLLVCVHRVLNVFRGPVHNYLDVAHAVEEVALTGVIHGQLFVDTCFYLAGLLLAWYDLCRPQAQNFGRSLLLRYIRLTPAYAVVILFYASVFYKTGTGPLWDSFIGVERDACRNYWWTNLLYINNYVPTDTLCMFQSWSLAADMHYFVLGTALLMLVRRSQRWGVVALLVLGVASVALPFALTALQHWPAMLMFHPGFLKDIHRSPMFRLVYSASHNRASPYLMGIGTAMIMHHLNKRQFRFSPRVTWTMEIVATMAMMPVLFTSVVFYNPEHPYNALEAAFYAAITPVVWTFGLVNGTFSSILGSRSMVRYATTPRVFLILSKLTYCVYLVHWIYQMSATATLRAPYHQSDFKTMQEAANDILNSFALAFVLYLGVEAPTRNLSKMLLAPPKGSDSQLYTMTRSSEQGVAPVPEPASRVSADPNGNVVKTEH